MQALGTPERTQHAPASRAGRRTLARSWRAAVPLAALLFLGPGCFVFISTGPTHVDGATIVFVARDDHDRFVAHVRFEVFAIEGTWETSGWTLDDGAFRCDVERTVDRVRVGVTPPEGYSLVQADAWPRTLDVAAGEQETVAVRLRRMR